MLLTPGRFILLRLYNQTLGRLAVGRELFRRVAVKSLVFAKNPHERYVQAARYFSFQELDQ